MSDQISTVEISGEVSGAPSKGRRTSSVASKLLQAAALAAVLVPLASVTAEASTCSFNSSGSPCGISGAGADGFAFFDFDDPGYKVALGFDHVVGDFTVEIIAHELNEAAMLAKLILFPNYRPVPIGSDPDAPYIDFEVNAPAPCTVSQTEDCSNATNTWIAEGPRGPAADQGYDMRFYWTAITGDEFPDPHVLHNTGEDDQFYDFDMTDPAFPYTSEVPCVVFDTCSDPAVGGRDDMFNGFTLADLTATDAVPEPASLLLLGSGISGLLYRRRRRKQDA
jgi:hypothetical protein